MGSSPEVPRPFLELLEEQYALVKEYANTQTLLYNASANIKSTVSSPSDGAFHDENAPSKTPTIEALERREEAKWKLRSNIQGLRRQSESSIVSSKQLWSNHLALSERVIISIANNPVWHSNGLPNDAGRNNFAEKALEANTVAIAALNASIARIKDIEGSP